MPFCVTTGRGQVGGRRHLIFATRHQLDLLNRAKSWYVDATFKLYRQPFTQLLTVNAFVKAVDYVKQVPLVVCPYVGQTEA